MSRSSFSFSLATSGRPVKPHWLWAWSFVLIVCCSACATDPPEVTPTPSSTPAPPSTKASAPPAAKPAEPPPPPPPPVPSVPVFQRSTDGLDSHQIDLAPALETLGQRLFEPADVPFHLRVARSEALHIGLVAARHLLHIELSPGGPPVIHTPLSVGDELTGLHLCGLVPVATPDGATKSPHPIEALALRRHRGEPLEPILVTLKGGETRALPVPKETVLTAVGTSSCQAWRDRWLWLLSFDEASLRPLLIRYQHGGDALEHTLPWPEAQPVAFEPSFSRVCQAGEQHTDCLLSLQLQPPGAPAEGIPSLAHLRIPKDGSAPTLTSLPLPKALAQAAYVRAVVGQRAGAFGVFAQYLETLTLETWPEQAPLQWFSLDLEAKTWSRVQSDDDVAMSTRAWRGPVHALARGDETWLVMLPEMSNALPLRLSAVVHAERPDAVLALRERVVEADVAWWQDTWVTMVTLHGVHPAWLRPLEARLEISWHALGEATSRPAAHSP